MLAHILAHSYTLNVVDSKDIVMIVCDTLFATNNLSVTSLEFIIIIIMYIYYALINSLSAHMIHINLNMIFYTHVEHSPTKTLYIKY